MNGFLTTHILDTARGTPAQGVKIDLYRIDDDEADDGSLTHLNSLVTNDDGRTDSPILGKDKFALGKYQLIFHVKDYHLANDLVREDNIFLDSVPLIFTISEDSHYHVPLLLSPFSYSTYRGS